MKRRWIAVLLLSSAACGSSSDAQVAVVESGSSRGGGLIAVAARVRAEVTSGPIRLRITFHDGDGGRRDGTDDSLPYCPARTDCWWAASFPLDQFDGATAIRSARVRVLGTPPPYGGPSRVDRFDVMKAGDGRIRGTAPGDEGFVYLVGFDRRIRGGVFTSVVPADGRRVSFAPSTSRLLGPDAELRAYFYPVRVPRGG